MHRSICTNSHTVTLINVLSVAWLETHWGKKDTVFFSPSCPPPIPVSKCRNNSSMCSYTTVQRQGCLMLKRVLGVGQMPESCREQNNLTESNVTDRRRHSEKCMWCFTWENGPVITDCSNVMTQFYFLIRNIKLVNPWFMHELQYKEHLQGPLVKYCSYDYHSKKGLFLVFSLYCIKWQLNGASLLHHDVLYMLDLGFQFAPHKWIHWLYYFQSFTHIDLGAFLSLSHEDFLTCKLLLLSSCNRKPHLGFVGRKTAYFLN